MAVDQVPMVGYGDQVALAVNSTVYQVLYPLPDFTTDSEFLFEDEEERGIFLERIVGTVFMSWEGDELPTDARTPIWRLMPLGVNYDTGDANLPFSANFFANSPEWTNQKWWAERHYYVTGTTVGGAIQGPQEVDHPWWTHIEYRPKMRLGVDKNLWPVLAVRNPSALVRLVYRHRLTAFWRSR